MNTVAAGTGSDPSRTPLNNQPCEIDSGLRATTERTGSAVVLHVGGDIDASNESVWQQLVHRSTAIAEAPGPE
jgi:hypothetical protein